MSSLVRVGPDPIEVPALLAAVSRPDCGGIGLFVGVVRDHDHGRDVAALSYEAHPRSEQVIAGILDRALVGIGTPAVVAAAAAHRTGDLHIGDIAVVVATSAAHRDDALRTCHWLIDEVKQHAPIWKLQRFVDGSEEWVGCA